MIAFFLIAFVILFALAFRVRGEIRRLERDRVIVPRRPSPPPPRIFIPEGRSRTLWQRLKRRKALGGRVL